VGYDEFMKQVNALPKFVYPKTEHEYVTDLAKTQYVPYSVSRERINLDKPKWLVEQNKDKKYLAELQKKQNEDEKRKEAQKRVDEYNKLTPEQKKKKEDATAKAFKQGLSNEVANQVASTAKSYIDVAAPLVGKIAEKVNPLAGKAFGAAKQALDFGYGYLGIPEDNSNEAAGKRIAESVIKANRGSGKIKKAPKKIKKTK